MKKTVLLFSFSFIALSINVLAQAINYQKLKVPSIDAAGKAYDATGKLLGRLDKEGTVYDASDVKIAHVDAFGNVVINESGEPFGRTDSEGNFLIVINKKVTSWKSFHPESQGIQLCLIKDKKNEVVATIHKSYKQQGTGVLYYLVSKYATPAETKTETTATTKSQEGKTTSTAVKKKKTTTSKAKSTTKKGGKKKK